jgi:hypothetical protein
MVNVNHFVMDGNIVWKRGCYVCAIWHKMIKMQKLGVERFDFKK